MTRLAANFTAVRSEVTRRWVLEIGPEYQPGGTCSWVAPARTGSGEDAVLKIGWPHVEARDEAAGLAFWASDGVVRLLASATIDGTPALLLERCVPGSSLAGHGTADERDEIVAGVLRRSWREPPPEHDFRPLQQMCDRWADGATQRLETSTTPLDRGLLQAGIEAFRELPTVASASVVLFTDLHAGNILAAQREPWLAIDPKPYVGDPAYDVLQHLLNSPRLAVDATGLARRMAGLLDLDEAHLRRWAFARCAVAAVDEPQRCGTVAQLAP
jgi:streptomycin 6-kinase